MQKHPLQRKQLQQVENIHNKRDSLAVQWQVETSTLHHNGCDTEYKSN